MIKRQNVGLDVFHAVKSHILCVKYHTSPLQLP
uniref:Uncharacterized protein n=1 Tax=Anguilla anguilla TaxID=7936 RepID=A0A0E9VV68_ANGAN